MKRLIASIKKVLYWLPVIWKDQDWDHNYFLDIIIHKLASMEQYFRENTVAMDGPEYVEEIQAARQKLAAVRDELCEEAAFAQHAEKWGASQFVFKDGKFGLRLEVYYPNAETLEDNEQAHLELTDLLIKAGKDHQSTLEEAFWIITQNLQKWWD